MLSWRRPPSLRILSVMFLGFSSGLPLVLIGSTLQAWFTAAHVNLLAIGALSLIGIPYVWKFLWAPVMDRFVPPWGGRRRGWILITQLSLCAALFLLANMDPLLFPKAMSFLALVIAFLSASQDIAIDAYRTDILLPAERGIGSAVYIFAYRIAMLVSGGLALILADYIGWRLTYELMAVFIAFTTLMTYFGPEAEKLYEPPKTFTAAIIEPFQELLQRDGIALVLVFILFYKLGDALALSLMSNFLLNALGFSLTEVGLAFKTLGLIATILGAFLGGFLLIRMSLYSALMLFGIAQAFSNLMFMFLAYAGKNLFFMFSSIFIESFCSGMSTAALMAFLMTVCHHRYTATQYASLSALSAVARVFLGPVAAILVTHLGWANFYFWSFVLCFPGIILLSLIRNRVKYNAEVVEC